MVAGFVANRVVLEETGVWSTLTTAEQETLKMFSSGWYMQREGCTAILTLNDLNAANEWVMRQLRPAVIPSVQTQLVIPLFQKNALRIAESR